MTEHTTQVPKKELANLLFIEQHYDEIISTAAALKITDPTLSTLNIQTTVIRNLKQKYGPFKNASTITGSNDVN